MQTILREWEAFAATNLPAAASMNPLALRDHAQEILKAVAKDLSTPQGREAQLQKSLGHAPQLNRTPETAAQTHALLRAHSGFSINQLIAEYRALRASVLRLWSDASQPFVPHAHDIVRFNEAIDQAIAESVDFFSVQITEAEAALRKRRDQMHEIRELHIASLTASAIAHELGQPLNAVASYTEAALRLLRAGNPKPDRLARALESGAEQVQRAGHVVRELLHFLRSRDIAIEPVDLNEAVRKALAVVHSDGVDGVQTTLDLEPDLKPVLANALQVEKVLVNLLSNAVEAMRTAGVARPSVTISIRTDDSENMAHVVLRDSGPGLDEASAKRVFEPFYTTKRGGLGMGLGISRALVEAHGGALWLELGPGPGAAFHFTLPFAT